MTKKNSLCHTAYLRNHKSYGFHLWFMVHMSKMIISPSNFFSFTKFLFSGGGGGGGGGGGLKGQKIVQMTKNYVVLYISGTIHNMIVIYSTQV